MFESTRNFLGLRKESENIYNLIAQSEETQTGWYRVTDGLGRFIGYQWFCPGRMIRTTIPAPAGSGTDQSEVPTYSRVGCSFQSAVMTPDEDGIKNVKAKCVHCSSSLSSFLLQQGISSKDLPTRTLSKPFTQDRVFDSWGDHDRQNADGGYEYVCADPSASDSWI